MDGSTVAIVFATFLGPIAAVQAQKWIEIAREKRNLKLSVFAALMHSRAARLSQEHVQSLNRIEIAFFKVKPVMDAWAAYLDVLNLKVSPENNDMVAIKRDEKFCELLFAMSAHLKYPFNQTEIKNSVYRPNVHNDIENAQLKVLTWLSEVTEGKQSIPISAVIPEDVFAAQKVLAHWLTSMAEGKATFPISLADSNGLLQPPAIDGAKNEH